MGRRCGTHFAAAQRRSNNRSKLEHEAEGMLRCPQPAPRPALLGTSRGDRSPIRAIAALGLGAGGCERRPSRHLLLGPPPMLALPTYASPSRTLRPAQRFGQVQFGAVGFKPGQVTSRSAISCVPWHPKPRAERSDGPYGSLHPSGCAWGGVLVGWLVHRRMHELRALAGRSCPNEAAAAKWVLRPTPPAPRHRLPRSKAEGSQPAGSPFF